MAYQNVGTPRFYVDRYQWLKALGAISGEQVPVNNGLNPTTTHNWELNQSNSYNNYSGYDFEGGINVMANVNYLAVLGHKLKTINGHFNFSVDSYVSPADNYFAINATRNGDWYPDHDGFSIVEINPPDGDANSDRVTLRIGSSNNTDVITSIGSISYGTYYDIQAPDLSLKLSIESGGVKTIESKGGASLSNASYLKPADWGDEGAWQLDGLSNLRLGRKTWDLSFSFISDTDIFPVNANQSHVALSTDGYHDGTNNPTTGYSDIAADGVSFVSNILDGKDFYSQVWNKTAAAGNLPFIFQPNKDNNNEFAICRFDMKSLKISQVGHNLYSTSLKIRETW